MMCRRPNQYQSGANRLGHTSHKGTGLILVICVLMMSSLPTAYGANKNYLRTHHHPKPLTLVQTRSSVEFPRLSEYHGLAYDMFTGNPRGETVDLGFQPKHVFELTYEQQLKTSDDLFFVPDQVNVVGDMSCTFASTSNTYTGMSSYQSDLSASLSIEGSYEGAIVNAAFSASAEYKQMKNSVQEEEKVAVIIQAKCSLYHSSLQEKAQISEDFKQAIAKAYQQKSFDDFISKWGTHYTREVSFGATAIQRSFFTRKDVQELESMGVSVSAAVSASAYGANVGASLDTSFNQQQANKFSSTSREIRESYIGLAPPESGDAREWLAGIRDSDPVPIEFKLRPITDVITTEYFGNTYTQAQLNEIKTLLKSSITVKSTKSDMVGPADDTIDFQSRISTSQLFGASLDPKPQIVNYGMNGMNGYTPAPTNEPKYFKDPIYEVPNIQTKTISFRAGDRIDAIKLVLTDGTNDYPHRSHGGSGGVEKTFTLPRGVMIDYVLVWADQDGLSGMQFYLTDGSASARYGGTIGTQTKVEIKGYILGFDGTANNMVRSLRITSVNRQYSVILGFDQFKTEKVGNDRGVEFRDVDRPLPEFKSRKFNIYTRDGNIEGIQAVLALKTNDGETPIVSDFHGEKEGTLATYNVPTDKYIQSVKLWADSEFVKGIRFTLSDGTQSPMFGVEQGSSKSFEVKGHITGFYGYRTRYLRSLGVMYTIAI